MRVDAEEEEAFISHTHTHVSRKEIKCWPIKIGRCAVNRGRGRISIIQMCSSRILSLLLWALRSPHRIRDVCYFFLSSFSPPAKTGINRYHEDNRIAWHDSWMICNQIEAALMSDNVLKIPRNYNISFFFLFFLEQPSRNTFLSIYDNTLIYFFISHGGFSIWNSFNQILLLRWNVFVNIDNFPEKHSMNLIILEIRVVPWDFFINTIVCQDGPRPRFPTDLFSYVIINHITTAKLTISKTR